ncbi:heme-binding protein [Saccharothrix sp. S26]|uniref:GlcG/HbpS family heme-binding protein n=1 Tax=Saccharothrix sp. S26 TaxID=2907215 RepID=UPI001F2C2A38|nr:heme-binding protein [Saccharothrix sp. S26]MCE6998967.1 heme-binding protein [Saccharothrix sp. S26]
MRKTTIAVLVALSVAGAGGYAVADQQHGRSGVAVRTTTTITVDAAVRAAQAALDVAEKEGQRVTVAVVDRSGDVVVLLHGDGAGPQTEESARRKAFTSVSFNAPTSALAGRVTGAGATLRDIPGTLFLAGGVPVVSDGAPVAGIGVGGAPSGDLDERFARAGLTAIGG